MCWLFISPFFFFFSFSLFITLLFFIFFLLFLVACTRLYNPLCRSVRRSVGYTLLFSAISAFFAFLLLPKCLVSLFYPCPSPPACDLVSRVYGLVFRLSPWKRRVQLANQFFSWRSILSQGIFCLQLGPVRSNKALDTPPEISNSTPFFPSFNCFLFQNPFSSQDGVHTE